MTKQDIENFLVYQQLKNISQRLNIERKHDYSLFSVILYYNEETKEIEQITKFELIHNNNYQLGVIECLDGRFKDIAIQEIGKERLIKYLKG